MVELDLSIIANILTTLYAKFIFKILKLRKELVKAIKEKFSIIFLFIFKILPRFS